MTLTKIEFFLQEINSEDAFQQLAAAMGSVVQNDTINIPSQHGAGRIRKYQLEEGLLLRSWNLSLNKPLWFHVMPDPGATRHFHLTFLLNPETVVIHHPRLKTKMQGHRGMNILFTSTDIPYDVEIKPMPGSYSIDITFDTNWLANSFADAGDNMNNFMQKLMNHSHPVFFTDSTTLSEFRTLTRLHELSLSSYIDPLPVRAYALSLLAAFFEKGQTEKEVLESDFFYYHKMIEVEKILESHLEKKLPGIEEIARAVALSESTLKRHFKLMHGKSVYEYYLEIKMEYAKRLLIEQPLTVTEIALRLNYERTSSFIDMFKKVHGFSPGLLKKR